jgi:hypothetical protein
MGVYEVALHGLASSPGLGLHFWVVIGGNLNPSIHPKSTSFPSFRCWVRQGFELERHDESSRVKDNRHHRLRLGNRSQNLADTGTTRVIRWILVLKISSISKGKWPTEIFLDEIILCRATAFIFHGLSQQLITICDNPLELFRFSCLLWPCSLSGMW